MNSSNKRTPFQSVIVVTVLCVLAFGAGLLVSEHAPLKAQKAVPEIKKGDPLPENLFIELAKIINPAVVNISTAQAPRRPQRFQHPGMPQDPLFDFFERFMEANPSRQARPVQSLGTGFIIREDGLIVTNSHVVAQADIIKVQLSEKSKELYDATVIGKDDRSDIALIKINSKQKLPTVQLGSSGKLEQGQWVSAYGNPYGHGHSVSKGIISAIGREINELNLFPFIQTDASINPGNSGGPLVDTKGMVIGVNTAIDARAQGIGFAIPVDNVKVILPQLEKDGGVKRGYLGVYMADIDEMAAADLGLKETKGALITQVIQGSPADNAGVKPYDLIVKFGDKVIESTSELTMEVAKVAINQKVPLKVSREGRIVSLTAVIAAHPENEPVRKTEKGDANQGQTAPFDLGFRLRNYTHELAQKYEIPPLRRGQPIVVDVTPRSAAAMAGLAPGDVILDVNRVSVLTAKEAFAQLRKNGTNLLRVLKQDRVMLLYLRSNLKEK